MTYTIEFVAFIAVFLCTLGAVGFFCLRQYYATRRKGYTRARRVR
jgi:hypothetical protein